MTLESLQGLVRTNRWTELEQAWLAMIEQPGVERKQLLSVIDATAKASQGHLADTMGWAWLSLTKESASPTEALELGRDLLVKLSDGDELREEILTLYRQTHTDRADLEDWITRSGLKSGKSVRRALRFLDVGLALGVGKFVIHRTDDSAAEITEMDPASGALTLRTARGKRALDIDAVISDYDVADGNDMRVLEQLDPKRIADLATNDPATLVVGILRSHGNKMSRDSLKLLLSPKFVPAEKWSDWWTLLRNETRKTPNLRIEGRSPMFVIYDPAGRSPEDDAWIAFSKATTPREWLEVLEGYIRLTKDQKIKPDTAMLGRVQTALAGHIERFAKHKEPAQAFATALVMERVAIDGLPVTTDAHGLALSMLKRASDPVSVVTRIPDARLWSLAVACIEQAFPQEWPGQFAQLILYAPAGQCDVLAKKVEKAGRADLLPPIVDRALAEPGRYTDAAMWVWKGPDVEIDLPIPPLVELLGVILVLVGQARNSEGKAMGQSVNDMRARVRSGLSAKDYAKFRECVAGLEDELMAQAIRRQIERAEGLGPTVQDEMTNILRARFPNLYTKPKVAMWDDDSVLYFTGPGLKNKQDELHDIMNVKMRENAKAIGEAASHGDLSENSEYKFALEERDLLRARVGKLNRELSLAKLLEPGDIPSDHVSVGQRITLRPTAGGAPMVLTILGFDESDIGKQVYSYQSPMAMQLMGKKLGEVVRFSCEGHEDEYKIERIESVLA